MTFNQILLYVAYGIGGVFLLSGLIFLIGVLGGRKKKTNEPKVKRKSKKEREAEAQAEVDALSRETANRVNGNSGAAPTPAQPQQPVGFGGARNQFFQTPVATPAPVPQSQPVQPIPQPVSRPVPVQQPPVTPVAPNYAPVAPPQYTPAPQPPVQQPAVPVNPAVPQNPTFGRPNFDSASFELTNGADTRQNGEDDEMKKRFNFPI